MQLSFACLYLSLISISWSNEQFLLNGVPFPSSIYLSPERSHLFECQSKVSVVWKIYLRSGKIQIASERSIDFNQFDREYDGFYRCCSVDHCESLFVFSTGARAIDRHWTTLTRFHPNLLTTCHPVHFHSGYNEEFIELMDSRQIVRYNRSSLLVKHIRSTTHLFCKFYLDTSIVAIRVQTLLLQNTSFALLSDQFLIANEYVDLNRNERDFHRIAFEGDSVYFHCPKKHDSNLQWTYLSWNDYSMRTLPLIYHTDTKVDSVTIKNAGMYTCQVNSTLVKRVVLTILHPPRSSNGHYEETLDLHWNSNYLICCHLDALPYPIYSWTMKRDNDHTSSIWCTKRCCWFNVLSHSYVSPLICTSTNQFGMAKYTVHLHVKDIDGHGRLMFDQRKLHHHEHRDRHFSLIRKIDRHPTLSPDQSPQTVRCDQNYSFSIFVFLDRY